MDVDSDAARQILISLIDSGVHTVLEFFYPSTIKLNDQPNPFKLQLGCASLQVETTNLGPFRHTSKCIALS